MNWEFPSNNNGQIIGISDSGTETFKGNPLLSLAREICQNSLDAAFDDDTEVRVDFSMFQITREQFPDHDGLKEAFQKSLYFWKDQSDTKAKDFFEKGIAVLEKQYIPCLRISDYNTTGLTGVREIRNTSWVNLTKSSGVSDKKGSSGGSYGIGKFAPFACSELQTVFYNTVNIDGEQAFQGISRITSFFIDESKGLISTGMGFFGANDNKPMFVSKSLDDTHIREVNETGTDIFVLGFREMDDTNWKLKILNSVLSGFLYAILKKKLSVMIDNITVDSSTLEQVISTYSDAIDQNIVHFYNVLKSQDTRWFDEDFSKMGIIRMGVLKGDGLQNKVAMIRKNGMKIRDMTIATGFMTYMAVMIIEGDNINAFLRSIENPQHTKWEADRHTRPQQARLVLKNLNAKIQEFLNSMNDSDETDSISPVIGGYLSFNEEDNDEHSEETLGSEIKDIEIKKRSISASYSENDTIDKTDNIADVHSGEGTALTSIMESGKKDQGTEEKSTGSGSFGESEGEDNGTSSVENLRTIRKVRMDNYRVFCVNKSTGEYIIQFSVTENLDSAMIDIRAIAETQKYAAPIISARNLQGVAYSINGSRVKGIMCEVGLKNQIYVIIDHDEYCSMEVTLYGN